jgi:predicted dehydrogenase
MRDVLRNAVERIGRVSSANLDFSQLSSKYPEYKSGGLPNVFNPQMATGCLEDLGIYCVYPALDLFGQPDDIKASASFMATGADGSGGAKAGQTPRQLHHPDPSGGRLIKQGGAAGGGTVSGGRTVHPDG